MALDPNIALQTRGIQLKPYGQSLGEAMQMRSNALTLQSAELQAESAERALQEEQQLRGLFGSGQPIEERAVFGIVGPKRGADIMKGLASLREQEVKTARELYAHIGSVLGGIKATPEGLQPEAYATARAEFIRKGWIKPEEVPEQFDPAFLDRARQQAMTAEQQAQDADRVADNEFRDKEYADKRPGVLAGNEKAASEALDAQLVTEGRLLGAATNNQEWKAALAQLPPERAKLYPVLFSKGVQSQVNRAARTAEERIQQAIQQQQANTASYSAETSRRALTQPSFQAKEVLHDGKVVMANFDSKSGRWFDPATGNQIKAPAPAPTAAEMKDFEKFKQAGPILSAVGELSERINTLQGVAAKASGAAERQKAKLNLNDDVAEYESLVMGFTPLVARALGHTGVLTEQDVVSVRKLFPTPGDSKSLRDRKVARVNSIIAQLQGESGPAAPTAPPEVEAALKSLGSGRHTLSDGSVWEKDAAGKLRKVQ